MTCFACEARSRAAHIDAEERKGPAHGVLWTLITAEGGER